MGAASIKLIWCQGGNAQSSRLAVEQGWWYGSRADETIQTPATHGLLTLLDCVWDRCDFARYRAQVAALLPALAVVPDAVAPEDQNRVVAQGMALAAYSVPIIVPKCEQVIDHVPRVLAGKRVVLGYSVPTAYGGTDLPVWDFKGWPIHLLGGNPRRQAELCGYLNVQSLDGNLAWRLARRGIVIGENGAAGSTLRQRDGRRWPGKDAHLEALRRSLANLRVFWERRLGTQIAWNQIPP